MEISQTKPSQFGFLNFQRERCCKALTVKIDVSMPLVVALWFNSLSIVPWLMVGLMTILCVFFFIHFRYVLTTWREMHVDLNWVHVQHLPQWRDSAYLLLLLLFAVVKSSSKRQELLSKKTVIGVTSPGSVFLRISWEVVCEIKFHSTSFHVSLPLRWSWWWSWEEKKTANFISSTHLAK